MRIRPTGEEGPHKGRIVFRWADGRAREHDFPWRVTAPIRPSPRFLIVERSQCALPRAVVVAADDRPFQIVGVRSAVPGVRVEFDGAASRRHILKVCLDPSHVPPDKEFAAVVRTNHPAQPDVRLRFMVHDGGS
ncbi:MAG: hypothetical protein ACP5XB_01400 [Isosphaeraceae bacterium]